MKKNLAYILLLSLIFNFNAFNAHAIKNTSKASAKKQVVDNITEKTEEPKVEQKTEVKEEAQQQYQLEVTVKDIPKSQQTLFIPIKIDTMVVDFDKVALEGLATQNILAVASSSMDKVGTGIGLIKLDDTGLPETLSLKVLLKPVGQGQTAVSVSMVADEPALPSRGLIINDSVKVLVENPIDIEVTEKVDGAKKKLSLNQRKITLNVQRQSQKEETIFIPVIYDKSVVDIDETFGHTIVGAGISIKTFSSSAKSDDGQDGPGIEIVLSPEAEKDFSISIDLLPRKLGTSKLALAFPQTGHAAIIRGPVVDVVPQLITVNK